MRKREAFERELMCLVAELRRTRPPARRLQLRADSERLLDAWLELTGQQDRKGETEERIAYAVQARSYRAEKWEPAPTHDDLGRPL
jgi:hypothetical protein